MNRCCLAITFSHYAESGKQMIHSCTGICKVVQKLTYQKGSSAQAKGSRQVLSFLPQDAGFIVSKLPNKKCCTMGNLAKTYKHKQGNTFIEKQWKNLQQNRNQIICIKKCYCLKKCIVWNISKFIYILYM